MWMDILQIVGAPAIFSGIATIIVSRYYTKKDKQINNIEETENRLHSLVEEFNEFKKEQEEDSEVMRKEVEKSNRLLSSTDKLMTVFSSAVQALLRDRIIQMYNFYSKDKKYMPIYAKESLECMYKQYCDLGGTTKDVIEDLVNRLYSLPTEPLDFFSNKDEDNL